MKEINGYLLVEVGEGAKDFYFQTKGGNKLVIVYPDKINFSNVHKYKTVPKGNYSIVGLLSEIAEKDLPEDVWQEIAKYISEKKLSVNNCLILKNENR